MKTTMTAACVISLMALLACGPGRMPAPSPTSDAVAQTEASSVTEPPEAVPEIVFSSDVQPILERCRPCHFEGGKMYDKLPFDQAVTIRKLGTALFTRIQDEQEQALINAFLAQTAD